MSEDKKKNKSLISKILLFLLKSVIWIFLVTKIFYFKILDNIYNSIYYSLLVDHEIIISLSLVSLLILTIRSKRTFLFILGTIFFPLQLLFIKLPSSGIKILKFIYNLIFGKINFFNTYSYKLIVVMLFVLSNTLIIAQLNSIYQIAGSMLLLIILIIHFVRRFYTITKPARVINSINDFLDKNEIDLEYSMYIDKMNKAEEHIDDSKKCIGIIVEGINGVSLLMKIIKRCRNYIENQKIDIIILIYFVGSVLFSLTLTIYSFGFLYYSANYINEHSIKGLENSSIWLYFYFSFNTIFTINYGEYLPYSPYAKLLVSIEFFLGLIIGVILFLIFTNFITEKYKKDADILVNKLNIKYNKMNIDYDTMIVRLNEKYDYSKKDSKVEKILIEYDKQMISEDS